MEREREKERDRERVEKSEREKRGSRGFAEVFRFLTFFFSPFRKLSSFHALVYSQHILSGLI